MFKKFLIFLPIILLFHACDPKKENIEAKKRLMDNSQINPYDPPVNTPKIKISALKKGDGETIGKILELPYRYIAKKTGSHKSRTKAILSYARVNKIKIPEYKPVIPKKDQGASDRELPPKTNNFLELNETITVEYSPKGNFKVNIKNSMGFEKEIRWINRILYIKNNSDNFTRRKSIDNEHLKILNEPTLLFDKILELISYKIRFNYKNEKNYNGREVLVFEIEKSETPYKKNTDNQDIKITSAEGLIYADKENFSVLFIDFKVKWRFKSKFKNKKGENEFVDADFTFKRETTDIAKDIDIKTPKQEKILNVKIPPSEADAEEKILNFKKGHSMIEKLRKEKEKRDKLLGITRKKNK